MKILFICTGNTCRSPMAEGFFNMLAEKEGIGAEAVSAGIYADGSPVTPEAVEAAKGFGADISAHVSVQASDKLISDADLILTMTEGHKNILLPFAADKIYTLNEYAGISGEIPDPFGGDSKEYGETAERIITAVRAVVERLKK